jgi:hypothetical protein
MRLLGKVIPSPFLRDGSGIASYFEAFAPEDRPNMA